jgi:dihydropyrimidinase
MPAVTIAQGKVVWRNGQLDVQRGAGRMIARKPGSPVTEAQAKINERQRPEGVRRMVSAQQTP